MSDPPGDDPPGADPMATEKCLVLLGEARELLASPANRAAAPGEAALCAVECAHALLSRCTSENLWSRDERIAGLRTAIAAARAATTATAIALRDEAGPEPFGFSGRGAG